MRVNPQVRIYRGRFEIEEDEADYTGLLVLCIILAIIGVAFAYAKIVFPIAGGLGGLYFFTIINERTEGYSSQNIASFIAMAFIPILIFTGFLIGDKVEDYFKKYESSESSKNGEGESTKHEVVGEQSQSDPAVKFKWNQDKPILAPEVKSPQAKGCDTWRKAHPVAASRLKPGQMCYASDK